jgi:hypothetical protein
MDAPCDGGGNRHLSNIDLTSDDELAAFFNGQRHVPSGVCSIQIKADEAPWVVCPRRILCLGRKDSGERFGQGFAEELLLSKCGYPKGTKVGVWSELKMIYSPPRVPGKRFDYTFDYVLMPVGSVTTQAASEGTGISWEKLGAVLQHAGYTVIRGKSEDLIEGFPSGLPTIIEIMTSSTSGGNKSKDSTIPKAFINAVQGLPHTAPGINYRQVWARMVSQLIVKSEVGLNWGGLTFWVLQDNLIKYISSSTALDINAFLSDSVGEVNIIGLSYGEEYKRTKGLIELDTGSLYAGDIGPQPTRSRKPYFQDMVKAPVKPPLRELMRLLSKRTPTRVITV